MVSCFFATMILIILYSIKLFVIKKIVLTFSIIVVEIRSFCRYKFKKYVRYNTIYNN